MFIYFKKQSINSFLLSPSFPHLEMPLVHNECSEIGLMVLRSLPKGKQKGKFHSVCWLYPVFYDYFPNKESYPQDYQCIWYDTRQYDLSLALVFYRIANNIFIHKILTRISKPWEDSKINIHLMSSCQTNHIFFHEKKLLYSTGYV